MFGNIDDWDKFKAESAINVENLAIDVKEINLSNINIEIHTV